MKVLLFNGSFERKVSSASHRITNYFKQVLEENQHEVTIFNLPEANIPILDVDNWEAPESVLAMNKAFREADAHIWLTPLYHGSMTGAMKNCLDWLEISAKEASPYLTNKVVGLVCWADGGQAMQGINAMDSVAKALRAWTLPYCIPIVRGQLVDPNNDTFTAEYQHKFNLMAQLLSSTDIPQYAFS